MDPTSEALNIWWWFVTSLREVLTFLYAGIWKYCMKRESGIWEEPVRIDGDTGICGVGEMGRSV